MADTDLILKIIARDEYSAKLKDAKDAVAKMTDAEKEATVAAAGHAKSQIDLGSAVVVANQAMQLGGQVLGMLKGGYDALVGDTMKYAETVKDLSINLGLSTEETSKLLGVSQKFGVSNETLTSSLQMMVKRGMAPTLDGLAKLSDKVMAIKDPVARAKELTDLFGRGWTNLMPILEKGGAAIKGAAAEAEGLGKVLSEKDVDAVEKLEISANTFQERIDGIKTRIGTALIPVLNDAAFSFDALTGGVESSGKMMEAFNGSQQKIYQDLLDGKMSLTDYNNAINGMADNVGQWDKATGEAARAQGLMTDETVKAALAARDLDAAQQKLAEDMAPGLTGFYSGVVAVDKLDAANMSLVTSTGAVTTAQLYQASIKNLPVDAQLEVARSLGLVNEANYKVLASLKAADAEYLKTGDLAAYKKAVDDLNNSLDAVKTDIAIRISLSTPDMSDMPSGRPATAAPTAPKKIVNPTRPGGAQFAEGANFIIPPGYNENYPIGYGSSGEHVTVTPVSQTQNSIGSVTINIGSISKDYTPKQAGDDIVDRMRARGLIA